MEVKTVGLIGPQQYIIADTSQPYVSPGKRTAKLINKWEKPMNHWLTPQIIFNG